jgi:hypothetical protein
MNPLPKPIFIIGVHRSGTTLLRFILSSHARLYIPPESDFIPRFFLQNPYQSLSEIQVKKLLDTIFTSYRFVKEWKSIPPVSSTFYNTMETKNPAGFLDALYSQYASQYQAVRWGDKTPIYASYIKLLSTLFPAGVFIHILRDPRDAVASLLEKYATQEFHVDVFFAARNWVRRIKKARRDGIPLGQQRYLEIHYESLVCQPEATIQKICGYIGEVYDPAMLDHSGLAQQLIPDNSHFFDQVRNPINMLRMGRWQESLSASNVRITEAIAGELMTELGYELEFAGKLSISENSRVLLLGAKYFTLQSSRKMLELAGIVPPI